MSWSASAVSVSSAAAARIATVIPDTVDLAEGPPELLRHAAVQAAPPVPSPAEPCAPYGSQAKLVHRFDPQLGFPAVAIDESFGLVGSGYDPGVIEGQGPAAIAKAIKQSSSRVAKAIDGEANVLTAAICGADDLQPEEVCESPGVEKASRRLPKR
jgi:hypothetical protein